MFILTIIKPYQKRKLSLKGIPIEKVTFIPMTIHSDDYETFSMKDVYPREPLPRRQH